VDTAFANMRAMWEKDGKPTTGDGQQTTGEKVKISDDK
jgi:hypothetical protein